jgi:predicted ATP-grasp superfamily ATP-dependent carboligase
MPSPERRGSARPVVLVLDGYTNQALAIVRSLGRAGYRVLVGSQRHAPLAAWSRYAQGSIRHDGETREAFSKLRRWALARGAQVVLPVTERSCLLCNADRADWESAGITVGCPPDDVLMRAFDKASTLEYAAACGVVAPSTRVPDSAEECRAAAEEIGYPCVIKPRFSNAWDGHTLLPQRGPVFVGNAAQLDEVVAGWKQGEYWPLIQAFAPGRGKGVFALCDRGVPVMWFAHERLREVRPSGAGSSLRRSVPLEARLREPAERLLRAMQWHGPAMVEFRDDGGQPLLMEVNGRFWGSLELAVRAGADFPLRWMDILEGRAVEPPVDYEVGTSLRWIWGDVKRFLFILAGPPRGYPGRYPTISQGLAELFGRQPVGTRAEAWQRGDRMPAVGEWVQGITELFKHAGDPRAVMRMPPRRADGGPQPAVTAQMTTSGEKKWQFVS